MSERLLVVADVPDVVEYVQSLHSTATDSPLGRALSLSLNLHPVGVKPPELRYKEFTTQMGLDPDTNATKKLDCSDSNATWLTALFDQVLDATPNSGVDSWWTDGDWSEKW